jgi:hypothetical protein
MRAQVYRCRHCGCWVEGALGADPPGRHQDRDGTESAPRSPGDHTDCCDQCCYGEERCRDRVRQWTE